MPEVWSISVTRDGLGACALGLDMIRRDYVARWPMMRVDHVWALDVRTMYWMIAEALAALGEGLPQGEMPLALALSSPDRETACFVDAACQPLSAVYLDAPQVMPRREIPDRYAGAPEAASAYRNSVLRCIQQLRPEFCINEPPGLATIGAMVSFALTGHLADTCIPRGISPDYPDLDTNIYSAAGVSADCSYERVRCGVPFARISTEIAQNLGVAQTPLLSALAGVPVFHMGASDSARAYACAADPLSWSVVVGNQLRAQWTAGIGAISGYEIQIVDHAEKTDGSDAPAAEPDAQDAPDETKSGSEAPPEPRQQEKSRDEWTRLIHQSLDLDVWPGPGKNLCTYGCVSAPLRSPVISQMISACAPHEGIVPFELLSSVPVGSCGFHVIPRSGDIQMVGLTPAHEPPHVVRAMFEGLLYTLRDWRNALAQPGPVRLMLDKPWPPETIQWAADILAHPVFWIDDSAEVLAAMGAALALIRDLDLPVTGKPRLSASIVEPQPRTAIYLAHYRVHCALKQE